MQKVRALRRGSRLGIVAPASDVAEEAVRKGAAELMQLGFEVVFSESVFSKLHYFAGTHEHRARQLTEMFSNPDIDAIICARGGYGSVHLLQLLDLDLIRLFPKALVGYSDVTVLLQFLEQNCGVVCFHGPMVAREFAAGEPAYDRRSFLGVLTATLVGYQIDGANCTTLRSGKSRGRLSGGCLSLLTASLGTPYEFQTEEKVLFLEDVNTRPYQIDRMLMQLKLAGKFNRARGIVFGEMVNCRQGAEENCRLQEIVMNILQGFDFPVLYGFPSGHTSTGALTLPFGVEVLLDADGKLLRLEEAPVY